MTTHLAPDLTACDREPIHTPEAIQPHGVLLALRDPDLVVERASANAAGLFGRAVIGASLDDVFGPDAAGLRPGLANPSLEGSPLYLATVRGYRAVAHRHAGALILELEPAATDADVSFRDLYPLVRSSIARAQQAAGVEELCRTAAEEVKAITGFERVLVYRFDAEWHGEVVAETASAVYEPYLGLRFPASDIPKPARDLYRRNHLRLIPDATAAAVPLVGSGPPLDLSFAALRAVSPVHLEYLGNMGIVGSMSIAVLRDGELWGLISCHHPSARVLPFEARTACELLAQYLSQQLAARERAAELARRIRLKSTEAALLSQVAAHGDFVEGLANAAEPLLDLASAGGAAVLFHGACRLVGATPPEEVVRRLVESHADADGADVFYTDRLADHFPEAASYAGSAAGLLAVRISRLHRSYLLWFRPEVVQTVRWAGDPRKPLDADGVRLHPRKSFALWKETVRGRSVAWDEVTVAAAADLRNDVVGIVLRKAEELAQLSAELQRSNQELEAFSYSVSHDLRAPFRHIFGYAELLKDREGKRLDETSSRYLETIMESARYAGSLVDHLLAFSQMSRSSLDPVRLDLNALVSEVLKEPDFRAYDASSELRVAKLPSVVADVQMIRLVVRNLLSNAYKYSRERRPAVIEVGARTEGGEAVVWVRDNGVGFDMRYANKLFGVFQRLHRVEQFEGTGIGLANVRRIVNRHGGRTWAEATEGAGATFYFTLPLPEEDG